MKLSELLLNRFLYKNAQQNLETKDSVYDSANVIPADVPAIASGGAAQDINTSNVFIDGSSLEPGSIPPATLDVANWGWGQTCAFTSTSATQVNWGAGTFKSANGVSYSISGGNTGSMGAKMYIYFDLNVSSTAYQTTTTSANAVGVGKVLIAVAQNGATAATYNLNEANQIVGDNILANTINATKMNVGILSAISADLGTITAGLITGAVMQTASSGYRLIMSGANNSYEFRSGSTLLSEMKAMITPDSGLAGAVFQHGTGNAGISVYGQGIGLGDRAVSIFADGGTNYFSIIDRDLSTGVIETNMPFGLAALTSDDASAVDGTIYYNSTSHLIRAKLNGSWGDLGASGANTTLSNLGTTSINSDLVPDSSGGRDLGSAAKPWGTVRAGTMSGLTTLTVANTITITNTGFNRNGYAQPLIYHGYCDDADGSITKDNTDGDFTGSSSDVGKYTITHNFNSLNYTIQITTLRADGAGAYVGKVSALGLDDFNVTTFDDAGTPVDCDFMFVVFKN